MRAVRVSLLAVAVLLAVAGCSSGADDLRGYLADEWSFSRDYAPIPDAEITVDDDGNVEIATDLYTEFTQARIICGWVSDWVYDQGNGEQDSTIRILNRNGDPLAERLHANGSCG